MHIYNRYKAMQIQINHRILKKTTLLIVFQLIFILCSLSLLFGKGCSGTYFINGTAYSVNNIILKNTQLTVKFGNLTKHIITDSSGHFEIELAWTNACPSKLTEENHKQLNKKINPQEISISYADIEIILENNWEKYADCNPKSKDKTTWNKDLIFIKNTP